MPILEHRLLLLASVVALLAAVCGRATAQQFQYTYGGPSSDAAYGGVDRTTDGGFIAVGYYHSGVTGTTREVYVVKTDRCGSIQWASKYDFGMDDEGRKIRQTADGGYIVTGVTQNQFSHPNLNDIFLMKIDNLGAVTWAKTYGGIFTDEAWDLQIHNGGGNENFVVAGFTRSFGAGASDAFIMRTNVAGTPAYARVFGSTKDDYFYSCAVAANGDILAAGGTDSYGSGENILALRASGALLVSWLRHYGLAGNESARSVIELSTGDLVFAGSTTSAGTAGDGMLMKTNSTGTVLAARAMGNTSADDFVEVRQNPANLRLHVTGRWSTATNNGDMWLVETDNNLNQLRATAMGGTGIDRGWGLALVQSGANYETIIAGTTFSFGAGNSDIYLVEVGTGWTSGCNEVSPLVITTSFTPTNTSITPCDIWYAQEAEAVPVGSAVTGSKNLCFSGPLCVPNAPGLGDVKGGPATEPIRRDRLQPAGIEYRRR